MPDIMGALGSHEILLSDQPPILRPTLSPVNLSVVHSVDKILRSNALYAYWVYMCLGAAWDFGLYPSSVRIALSKLLNLSECHFPQQGALIATTEVNIYVPDTVLSP